MSSTNLLISPNLVEDICIVVPSLIQSKQQGLLPCYNKFLTYYNLPLLNNNQTIKSFLNYLKSHKFNHKTIFSFNPKLGEAHIYTPNNIHLLNNYLFIESYQLPTYYNLPLKSQAHSTTNSNLNLNIVTHNVQGFNVLTKRQLWEEYCLKENFNIASITETKLNTSRSQKFLNTKNFSYFWASLENSAGGTTLIINNKLKPYIHNILIHHEGAVAIDLFFKHDFKFRIILVYLSTSNKPHRDSAQEKAIIWIKQALSLNFLPIVLGDFNASTNYNLNLNIVTHNVQGFNVLTKRQLWEEYCIKENFNIASITKTKLNTS